MKMSANKKIYVNAVASTNPFGEADVTKQQQLNVDYISPELKPVIKKVCGQPLRQASHLVELGVIGAQTLNLKLGKLLNKNSRLYTATGMGDISKNLKLFNQVSPPVNGLAAPFDFINSSANTTAFYVAKILELNGRNLTVSRDEFSFETALQLAASDLMSGDSQTALVGGFDEKSNSSCTHFNEMLVNDNLIPGQGSGWMYLSTTNEKALGEISSPIKINTDYSTSIKDWSSKIYEMIENKLDITIPNKILPGYKINESELNEILNKFKNCTEENYIKYSGTYYTASAFGIARLLENNHKTDTQYVHVMRNEIGETMCVLFRAYKS